jgi:hypothetical protein
LGVGLGSTPATTTELGLTVLSVAFLIPAPDPLLAAKE